MNPELALLQPYPFEKLRVLLDGITPANKSYIALSVGEPKHDAPQFVLDALIENLRGVQTYPSTRGTEALRQSIANWLCQRFQLSGAEQLASSHILPVNGTREALFAIAQCVLDRTAKHKDVLMPNPFYQIYEGAVLLAGCKPAFYNISADGDNDINAISDEQFASCQLFYLCNPGNPTGSVLSKAALTRLIEIAQEHDFLIVSDECYSEIYRESAGAPTGLLQAAHAMGNTAYDHCLVFHSLSKRSNLPGMRSGFVAGDKNVISQFLQYRTYHGCSMAPPVQHASTIAWQDEKHVQENRRAYDEKYGAVLKLLKPVMQVEKPDAGFYLWPTLPVDDTVFTQQALREQNVALVPGSYLGREVDGINPGGMHVRLALVAQLDECIEAATRLVSVLDA
ncbi:UNVERIFIED_CONTAM: hypothetical protein GTU68_019983 [Idotea baltica]|nr:hypothetical protein [Idotea baltica]